MHSKKHMICYIITFILLFTGICGQQIEANPFLKYTHNDNTVSTIISGDNLTSMDVCTTEMICRQTFSRLTRANRSIQSRRDFKSVSQTIFYRTLLNALLKFFSTEDALFFQHKDGATVAIKYIQNTDGKKRSYFS